MTDSAWAVWCEKIDGPKDAKRVLSDLVDGTPAPTNELWSVTDEHDLAVAVTGCGERSEIHAKMISRMRGAILGIARGPVMPPPDPGAHSWEAYAEFWRAEAAKYMAAARRALSETQAEDRSATAASDQRTSSGAEE